MSPKVIRLAAVCLPSRPDKLQHVFGQRYHTHHTHTPCFLRRPLPSPNGRQSWKSRRRRTDRLQHQATCALGLSASEESLPRTFGGPEGARCGVVQGDAPVWHLGSRKSRLVVAESTNTRQGDGWRALFVGGSHGRWLRRTRNRGRQSRERGFVRRKKVDY